MGRTRMPVAPPLVLFSNPENTVRLNLNSGHPTSKTPLPLLAHADRDVLANDRFG
jgi:hypothetical protein